MLDCIQLWLSSAVQNHSSHCTNDYHNKWDDHTRRDSPSIWLSPRARLLKTTLILALNLSLISAIYCYWRCWWTALSLILCCVNSCWDWHTHKSKKSYTCYNVSLVAQNSYEGLCLRKKLSKCTISLRNESSAKKIAITQCKLNKRNSISIVSQLHLGDVAIGWKYVIVARYLTSYWVKLYLAGIAFQKYLNSVESRELSA